MKNIITHPYSITAKFMSCVAIIAFLSAGQTQDFRDNPATYGDADTSARLRLSSIAQDKTKGRVYSAEDRKPPAKTRRDSINLHYTAS